MLRHARKTTWIMFSFLDYKLLCRFWIWGGIDWIIFVYVCFTKQIECNWILKICVRIRIFIFFFTLRVNIYVWIWTAKKKWQIHKSTLKSHATTRLFISYIDCNLIIIIVHHLITKLTNVCNFVLKVSHLLPHPHFNVFNVVSAFFRNKIRKVM